MGKHNGVEVEVVVFKVQPKKDENGKTIMEPNANGGFYQRIGRPEAKISINGEVIIDKVVGRVAMFFRDEGELKAGNGSLIVDFKQSYRNVESGREFENLAFSQKWSDILQIETYAAMKKGMIESSRDIHMAESAGMSAEDVMALAKDAIGAAMDCVGEVEVTHATAAVEGSDAQSFDSALKDLDKQLGADIG